MTTTKDCSAVVSRKNINLVVTPDTGSKLGDMSATADTAQYSGIVCVYNISLCFSISLDDRALATWPCKHWLITLTLTRRSI